MTGIMLVSEKLEKSKDFIQVREGQEGSVKSGTVYSEAPFQRCS